MQERHADPLDEAAALTHALADAAVAEIRRANAPETHPDFDGKNCVDCDNPIPKPRLKLGKVRCVACQSDLEKRQQHFRRVYGQPQPVATLDSEEKVEGEGDEE